MLDRYRVRCRPGLLHGVPTRTILVCWCPKHSRQSLDVQGSLAPRLEENALAEEDDGDALRHICFQSVCAGCFLGPTPGNDVDTGMPLEEPVA